MGEEPVNVAAVLLAATVMAATFPAIHKKRPLPVCLYAGPEAVSQGPTATVIGAYRGDLSTAFPGGCELVIYSRVSGAGVQSEYRVTVEGTSKAVLRNEAGNMSGSFYESASWQPDPGIRSYLLDHRRVSGRGTDKSFLLSCYLRASR